MTIRHDFGDAERLWLDDLRLPPDGWLWAKTAWEAIDILKSRVIVEVSLDHDLGDDQVLGTGLDVLRWIEEQVATREYAPPILHVHSMNPVGRARMQAAIEAILARKETRCE